MPSAAHVALRVAAGLRELADPRTVPFEMPLQATLRWTQRRTSAVKLAHIHADDVIEVNKGGRRVYARVVEIRDGVVQFEPLCRGISYRHASAREIVRHWRKAGRRGPGPADEHDGDQPVQLPREQLSLPMAT